MADEDADLGGDEGGDDDNTPSVADLQKQIKSLKNTLQIVKSEKASALQRAADSESKIGDFQSQLDDMKEKHASSLPDEQKNAHWEKEYKQIQADFKHAKEKWKKEEAKLKETANEQLSKHLIDVEVQKLAADIKVNQEYMETAEPHLRKRLRAEVENGEVRIVRQDEFGNPVDSPEEFRDQLRQWKILQPVLKADVGSGGDGPPKGGPKREAIKKKDPDEMDAAEYKEYIASQLME